MKALSIRQPWARLIVNGYKDVENRTWSTKFRGRVYVHAGMTVAGRNYNDTKHLAAWAMGKVPHSMVREIWRVVYQRMGWMKSYYGVIVGEVDIVDCVTKSDSPWFEGPYGFVLASPVAYKTPIPYKGRLGFFEVLLDGEHGRMP